MSDDPSFEAIVKPHLDRLFRLAWRLTGTRNEADDLFQELLTKAYVKLETLETVEEPGAWLARVMYNTFIDQHRARQRRLRLVVTDRDAELDKTGDASTDPARSELIDSLEKALAGLPEAQRAVLLLHDAEGYKITEIEEVTGLPAGTIKSRLHRARAQLREILGRDGTIPGQRT